MQPRPTPGFKLVPQSPERDSKLARADLTGCPWHDVKTMLRAVGLRPTRQRMALGWLLFAKGDRHLTAEMLYEEAIRAGLGPTEVSAVSAYWAARRGR